eukprot:m.168556 g.168556  ORF g.168556 m.168556 type:complete len:338 (-) comp12972_c0_seq1:60-1073(-)
MWRAVASARCGSLHALSCGPHHPLASPHRTAVHLANLQLSATEESTLYDEPPQHNPNGVHASLPSDFVELKVAGSRQVSPDSTVLTFRLPEDGPATLEHAGIPSGIKVRKTLQGVLLDKSYSPITTPWTRNTFDLLVKQYPPVKGGGLGHYLFHLKEGDTAEVRFKPERFFWGQPYVPNRWKHILMVGAGTGIAPLFQMAASILELEGDTTRMSVITCNRSEDHVLMGHELDALAATHPDRIQHYPLLDDPPNDWPAWPNRSGRITADDIVHVLSRVEGGLPSPRTALVCGPDGFLDAVCGDKITLPCQGGGERLVQGPVRGILSKMGYQKEEVTRL